MRQGRHRARPEGARRPRRQRSCRVRTDRRAGEGRAGQGLITSKDNERLKLVRKLHERRWREKLGLFAVEGEDLVVAAGGVEPVELLVAGENVEPSLLAEVSTLAHPPRVIGVYRRDDLPRGPLPEVGLALWHVADPGNVGTLLRAADALGPAFVALSAGCADPTGPKALRASMGAVFRVPTCAFDDAPGRRVALVPRDGTPLGEVELEGPTVFLLGAEREGLPGDLRVDERASIPQAGGAESLNVALAGAIALYERLRR
ncbi:MAG: RNA methyltransferase [Actinobacteria bacterium]|nr:MAG: RNA methyltransferase [Actinomycetota bacterium]